MSKYRTAYAPEFRQQLVGFCRIKQFLSKNGIDFIEQFLLGIA